MIDSYPMINLQKKSPYKSINIPLNGILVGGFTTPLKNDGVRQLGLWQSQYYWKINHQPALNSVESQVVIFQLSCHSNMKTSVVALHTILWCPWNHLHPATKHTPTKIFQTSMAMQQEPLKIGGTDSIYFWPKFQGISQFIWPNIW